MSEQKNTVDGETPTHLIPKMGELPVTSSAFYQQLIMTDKPRTERENVVLNGQIDPFAEEVSFDDSPATGVLLTFEQGWYQKGLALGELRKSLCLAPGEVTKLAMVDWRRDTSSQDDAARSESEMVSARSNDMTAAAEVQAAVALEARAGAATSLGESSQKEESRNSGFFFSGGMNAESSNSHKGFSANSSVGSRNVASSAAKNLQRRTAQLSQASRSARATQIREVSEAENQSTSTRIVANYNHAHALTMQYYEVLQTYSVKTEVVRADRCVFIPMKPMVFSGESLSQANDATIELLRRVLREMGATELDEMVGNFHSKAPDLSETISLLEAQKKDFEQQIKDANAYVIAFEERFHHALAHSTLAQQASEASPGNQELINACLSAQDAFKKVSTEFIVAQKNYNAGYPQLVKELEKINNELAAKYIARSDFGRLFGILDQNRLVLNQQMWMRMDDYKWHRVLAGTVYPNGEYEGEAIGELAEPRPVGYFGNYVAFRWDFPRGTDSNDFENRFINDFTTTETTIVLPTEGVFAEAVLGRANCAEKIDITRFWNWQDSPIPLLPPSIAPVGTDSRARDVAVSAPLNFSPALAALRELNIPDSISDNAILGALQKGIGSDDALINAALKSGLTAADHASTGAGRAGQGVLDSMKNMQDFVVGLANSEAVKVAGQAIAGGATGGMSSAGGVSSLGGLINAATDMTKTAAPATGATAS